MPINTITQNNTYNNQRPQKKVRFEPCMQNSSTIRHTQSVSEFVDHAAPDALIEFISKKHIPSLETKDILSVWRKGNNDVKLALLKTDYIRKLDSQGKAQIVLDINKMPQTDKLKFSLVHNLMLMTYCKYKPSDDVLERNKKSIRALINSEDSREHLFLIEHCIPYFIKDNHLLNDLIENTKEKNLIKLIQTKNISFTSRNIKALWSTEEGQTLVQLELLKSGHLDNQTTVSDKDIKDFLDIIEIEDDEDQKFIDSFNQALNDMQKRRRKNAHI